MAVAMNWTEDHDWPGIRLVTQLGPHRITLSGNPDRTHWNMHWPLGNHLFQVDSVDLAKAWCVAQAGKDVMILAESIDLSTTLQAEVTYWKELYLDAAGKHNKLLEKPDGERLYDELKRILKLMSDCLVIVRKKTVTPVHSRDDHSKNCGYCQLEIILKDELESWRGLIPNMSSTDRSCRCGHTATQHGYDPDDEESECGACQECVCKTFRDVSPATRCNPRHGSCYLASGHKGVHHGYPITQADAAVNGLAPASHVHDLQLALKAAQKFKAWVHDYLDSKGVPANPDPEGNAEHGCRISGRMQYVFDKLAAESARLDAILEDKVRVEYMGTTKTYLNIVNIFGYLGTTADGSDPRKQLDATLKDYQDMSEKKGAIS